MKAVDTDKVTGPAKMPGRIGETGGYRAACDQPTIAEIPTAASRDHIRLACLHARGPGADRPRGEPGRCPTPQPGALPSPERWPPGAPGRARQPPATAHGGVLLSRLRQRHNHPRGPQHHPGGRGDPHPSETNGAHR